MAEKEIRTFIEKYVVATDGIFKGYTDEMFAKWVRTYCSPNLLWIRPSGNPMGLGMFKGMWSSGKLSDASCTLVSIDSVQLTGCWGCLPKMLPALPGSSAFVTFKTHDKFKYESTPNDDIVMFTAVLEKGIGGWKLLHLHRATGQKPE